MDIWPTVLIFGITALRMQWKKKYTEQDIITTIDAGDVDAFRQMIYSPTFKDIKTVVRIEDHIENLVTDLYKSLQAKKSLKTVSEVIQRLDEKKQTKEKIVRVMKIFSFFKQRESWSEYLKMVWSDMKDDSYFADFFGDMTEEDWAKLKEFNETFQRELQEQRLRQDRERFNEHMRAQQHRNLIRNMYPTTWFNQPSYYLY